jgi:hypothetical protein
MTKPMPTPVQLLRRVAQMASDAADNHPNFHMAVSEVLDVPISSGWAAGTRGSDISDPTPNAALATNRLYWSTKLSDTEAAIIELHAHAKAVLAMMSSVPVAAVDPKLKRLARCCEPLCEELIVADGRCKPHYDAKRYEDKKATA